MLSRAELELGLFAAGTGMVPAMTSAVAVGRDQKKVARLASGHSP
jgi:hypothetical protein